MHPPYSSGLMSWQVHQVWIYDILFVTDRPYMSAALTSSYSFLASYSDKRAAQLGLWVCGRVWYHIM